ncbi:LysR family transcriptional regulator [Halomonas llamarensis]|uniref:LysR family transcriptional regulator n=1 Tax=Halomonas llamarensis TaxID=2945104 RepID=A0ABT0SQ75_9GAMM|nr:LysR family transcriptional regulator [Halomonas llamarensis]MCL7929509.1 LysR family transcriptional regulator [Halomonas llamarensis]
MHDFDELTAFTDVMTSGSLTQSARQLGLAKSTLSRRISQLEQRVGQPLLRRQANRLIPTEAGELFHRYCRQMLNLAEQSQSALDTLRHEVSGELEVHTHSGLVRGWLGRLIYRFMDEHPGISVTLRTCDAPPHAPDAHQVTLWLGPLPQTPLRQERLGWLTRRLYASPSYLANRPDLTHPRELVQHDWVDLLGDTQAGLEFHHREYGSYHYSPPPTRYRVNQMMLHADAIARGRGIGLMPDWLAANREAAHPGELICCLPNWQPDALPVTLVYAYGHQPRKVSALLNMLRDATPRDWQSGYATATTTSPVPSTSAVAPTLLHQR